MSRLIVIGSVAVASAALLTGTAAAVGVVASQSAVTAPNENTQVRVVAPAAAVTNQTVKKAISVATAKPTTLPKIPKVKHITVHHSSGGSTSAPRVVIVQHVVKSKNGKHRTVVITVTETPSASPTPSPTSSYHHDGGDNSGEHHHHGSGSPSPFPTGTPPHGGDD